MKRIAYALSLALLPLAAMAQEFQSIPLESLKLDQFSKLENGVLVISVPKTPGITNETRGASYAFPTKLLAGKNILLSMEIRYKDVATDVQNSRSAAFGVKSVARLVTGGAVSFQAGSSSKGTHWEWTPVATYYSCKENLEKFQLMIGIQWGWGTVEIRNLRWRYIDLTYVDYKLPDGFRCEYTPDIAARPVLRGVMSGVPQKVTPQDIRDLASWGGNLMRFQLTGCLTMDLKVYQDWIDKCLDHLDSLVPVFEECKVWYIIDLHSPPGGRYRTMQVPGDPVSAIYGQSNSFHMMNNDKLYQCFQETWCKIARRFRGRPFLYGYDLVNEPYQSTPVKHSYLQLQYDTARLIREIDPDTPIVVESNRMTSPEPFSYLVPLPLKNVIYQVHMYEPSSFTHQGVGDKGYVESYPSQCRVYPDSEKKWDAGFLRKVLQPVVDFQKKYDARILVGEFSAITWAPGAEKYLDDVIAVFEEIGWDWCYHAFREWQGWSVEHAGPPPNPEPTKEDTPRKKVLLKWFKRNQKP